MFFEKSHVELQQLENGGKMGDRVSQLVYLLRKMRLEALLEGGCVDAADAVGDLLSDEAACPSRPDAWVQKWAGGLKAF